MRVQSLALLSGLRIWRCCQLWCRLQKWLKSGVAVAVVQAGGHSSDSTPSLGTSTCCGCGPKKTKDKINRVTLTQCPWVQSLALLSGLRIQCCQKLQCRSQMQLRSGDAVAVA